MISANLMTEKPESGKYLELSFNSQRTNAWVLFSEEGLSPWIGIFGQGRHSLFSGIARFYGSDIFLIIADGQGYIFNARDKRLIRQTSWDYCYSCYTVPNRSFVLVADTQEVWACSVDNDVFARARVEETWVTPLDKHNNRIPTDAEEYYRIALDGIVFENVTDTLVSGKAWEGQDWHSFVIDLRNMNAIVEVKIIFRNGCIYGATRCWRYPLSQDYINKMASIRII
jgi:hypothetical protein